MRNLNHEIKVIRRNQVEIKGHGVYDMEYGNYIEHRVAKLGLLGKLIEAAIDRLADCGENNTILGKELEALAEIAYEEYAPFISEGINIFEIDNCFIKLDLENFKTRPRINGYTNAGPNDQCSGLPEGWWWNYPGYAEKMFHDSFIVISSVDRGIRVDSILPELGKEGCYEPDFSIECHEGDYEREIYEKFPKEQADEICEVVNFCKEVL